MKELCRIYIERAKLIGALYCIVPSALWFGAMMFHFPLRDVYLLRLGLTIVVGGYVGALANDYGVKMWLIKHRSKAGPATVVDGAIIGACVGIGVVLIGPLTGLIATNHPEEAKLFIIAAWLISMFNGCWMGAVAASIGIKHVDMAVDGSSAAPGIKEAGE